MSYLRILFLGSIVFFNITSCVSVSPKSGENLGYSDSLLLKKHVYALAKNNGYRTYLDNTTLNKSADYIRDEFLKISNRVSIQGFKVEGRKFRNIICSVGPENAKRIIIGAHYDVCGNQAGADDNASGVAGLLELARLLKSQTLKYRIDFVAYSLEEPPYFKTQNMGSYIHARYLADNKISVQGMICLEMIGYFTDLPHSQKYPVGFLKWFYGNTGNYITIVQKFGNGSFGRKFNRSIRKNATIETKFFRAPKFLPGVDFSDHRNYWEFGYNSVMITNSAFYRNSNYHTIFDTPETLDYYRMSKVVDETFTTILELNK